MIVIEDIIVDQDILRLNFMCDLAECRGECCVQGSSGAPVEEQELEMLERDYLEYKVYMQPKGVETVKTVGYAIMDGDGELTTPLIDQGECAYAFMEDGVTLCAIERAWREGKIEFQKPISCHLYPIRVMRFRNGTMGLNYQRWNVCAPAIECGNRVKAPIYKVLKEPIIRAFGEKFYRELSLVAEQMQRGESLTILPNRL